MFTRDNIPYAGDLLYFAYVLLVSILFLHSLDKPLHFILYIVWPFFLIINSPAELIIKAFHYFRIILAGILLPSIILYPFILLGFDFSYGDILPVHEGKQNAGILYHNYLFTYVLSSTELNIEGYKLFRLSSLFDEPGVVGTVAALLIIATNFKRDFINLILIVAGTLSFSLAFIILIAMYLLFYKRTVLYFAMIAGIGLFYFAGENPFFNKVIINRLLIVDGNIAGDNRTTLAFNIKFLQFFDSSLKWFGNSDSVASSGYYASSWKNLIWDYGIVGTFFMLMSFVFYKIRFVKVTNKLVISFLILFFLNIYQRPYILNVTYFLLFSGALVLLSGPSFQPVPGIYNQVSEK
jgi:hypothetical protein